MAAVLGLLGFLGYRAFGRWQVHRLVQRGEGFLSIGDTRSANLAVRHVLQLDPDNVDAARLMAIAVERNGQREAIDWRRRVVSKRPDSIADAVELARTALLFDDIPTAESALKRIEGKPVTSAMHHQVIGQLALIKKDSLTARAEFAEAAKLDPENKSHRLRLAVIDLESADAAARQRARAFLETALEDTTMRAPAARALLNDKIQRHDPSFIRLSARLQAFPEATFRDRLNYLQILLQVHLPEFATALADVQAQAATDPVKLTELLSWMSVNQQSVVAIDWSKRLPAAAIRQRPVFVALSDCYIAALDCDGLRDWCQKTNWGDLEFLRHGYLARAFRDCGKPLDSDLEWSKALQGASTPEDLHTLQRGAAKWGWKQQSIDLLWQLTKDRAKQRGALDTLYTYYSENSDTGNLYRVALRLSQIAPDDAAAQNNLAQLSLLLGHDIESARNIAQKLHESNPASPDFASTYAFALYVQGKSREAAKILGGLKPEDLQRPDIAAYYGIILAATGEREKAAPFLELGAQAHLLPEEKALLEKATGSLR